MIINFKNIIEKKKFIKESKNKIFDFIIIGTGPAAYVLYEHLNKKNKNILIIEKGNLYYSENIETNSKQSLIANENYKIKKNSRISALGGTGNIWAGVSSYIEEFEMYSRWDKNKNLWPITHSEISKYYKKLKSKYLFKNLSLINDLNKKNRDNKFVRERSFFSNKEPFRFNNLDHYKESDLLINAKVKYLNDFKGKTFIELDDNKTKIYTKKILVCCGGLETNFLILRSVHNQKLKNVKNKSIVGRYFMDHPKFQLGIIKPTKSNLDFLRNVTLKNYNKWIEYKGISLSQDIQAKKKLLNSYVRFEKYLFIELVNKIKKRKYNFRFFLEIFKLYVLKIFNKDFEHEKFKITMYNEMVPSKNNRIIYKKTNKKEKFIITYKFSNKELLTIKFLVNILNNNLNINWNNQYRLTKKNIENILLDSSHHMGGTIMGFSKKNSFVNKNLQIHGVRNVYICSTSVFPTSGSLNPTMTLCALAIKLAKYLNKQ